jgi:hypothetical protein
MNRTMPRTSRYIPPPAQRESTFLETVLPIRVFAHLTALQPMSRNGLDYWFKRWIAALQAHHRMTIGWVMSVEAAPKPHIHAALIAANPLDCSHAAHLWRKMVSPRYPDAAIVEPYHPNILGIGYVLKQNGVPTAEVQFSDNIAYFARASGNSLFPTSSAERRQRRRIRNQTERGACESNRVNQSRRELGDAPGTIFQTTGTVNVRFSTYVTRTCKRGASWVRLI